MGCNGVGKSTLLKLITGELIPNSGSIESLGHIAYLPQQQENSLHNSIADFLNASEKLQALTRITSLCWLFLTISNF